MYFFTQTKLDRTYRLINQSIDGLDLKIRLKNGWLKLNDETVQVYNRGKRWPPIKAVPRKRRRKGSVNEWTTKIISTKSNSSELAVTYLGCVCSESNGKKYDEHTLLITVTSTRFTQTLTTTSFLIISLIALLPHNPSTSPSNHHYRHNHYNTNTAATWKKIVTFDDLSR